jgi:signal transduction histidine kinase
MFDKSRVRLTLGYVGVLTLILLLFGAVVVVGFRSAVAEIQNRHLLSEAENREGIVSGGGNVYAGGSDEFGWSVVGPDGRPLGQTSASAAFGLPRPDLARQTARQGTQYRTVEVSGDVVRIVSRPVERAGEVVAVIQVAQSRAVIDEAVARFLSVLVPVGLVALALAAVGGHFISGRAMRPIRFAFDKQRAFVADASHELKTPLTLIRADAEVLARGERSQDDRYLLENLLEEADRMDSVLSDLLVLARLDAGKLAVAREPFNLAALLDNALRHTKPGGTVAVAGRRDGDRVFATVEDPGPGIPPEHLSRVFDRFYQTGTDRAKREGTGLGLAIARDLARAQGGDLTAGNRQGAGAVFSLSLPAASR